MGKSDAKRLLHELCRAVFGEIPENCIFFQDGPMAFVPFNSEARPGECMGTLTGAHLLQEMRSYLDAAMGKNYKCWLKVDTDQQIFVFCLDEADSEKVSIAKSETRRVRDKARKTQMMNQIKKALKGDKLPNPIWKWDGVSPIVTLDGPLPRWGDVIMNSAARARATDEFVALAREHWSVDVGWTLIFDGHKEGAKFIMTKGGNGIRMVEDCDETDIRVTHGLGEADQKLSWYARRYWNIPACVISGDTDQLTIQLLNLINSRVLPTVTAVEKEHEKILLSIERAAPLYVWMGRWNREKSTGNTAKPPKQRITEEEKDVETVQYIVNIKELYVNIANLFSDKAHEQIHYPVVNAITAIAAAGNDFINGYYWLSMKSILHGLLKHKEFVGDLFHGDAIYKYAGNGRIEVTREQLEKSLAQQWNKHTIHEDLELDVHAFQKRLIPVAYMEAYLNRAKSEFADIIIDKNMDLDELEMLIRKGVAACNPKRLDAHVPSLAAIIHNCTRIWWTILYGRFGSIDTDLLPHPLDGWGWVQQDNVLQLVVNETTGELEPKLNKDGTPVFKTEYYYKENFDGTTGRHLHPTQSTLTSNAKIVPPTVHILSSSSKTSSRVTTAVQHSESRSSSYKARSSNFSFTLPISKKSTQSLPTLTTRRRVLPLLKHKKK